MKTAIILHSVSDATHCVKNKLNEGRVLLSTHSSVDVYLKEKHDLDCQCLSRFMSTEEMIDQKKLCSDIVDNLLGKLDHKLSPVLNKELDLKVDYFIPLYSYAGKYHLLTYSCFTRCVKKALESFKIDKTYFYDYRFDIFLNTGTNMSDVVNRFFNDIETDIIKIPDDGGCVKIFKRFKKALSFGLKGVVEGLKRKLNIKEFGNKNFCNGKKTILMTPPLYELEFFKQNLKKYNIFNPIIKNKYIPSSLKPEFNDADFTKETDSPLIGLFLKDVSEDFLNNAGSYLKVVDSIKEMNKRYPIAMGMWGASPCWGVKGLIYEYLQSEKIKVLGSQHGCLYGESFEPWHFDSDLNRCDYFLSYGFTEGDLKRLYPGRQINCEILPFGKIKFAGPLRAAKKIDILFPITLSISMFEGGMVRIAPHDLAERQTALLKYLDSLEGLDIYVKPFAYSNQDNCSTLSLLKKLKNVIMVNNKTLSEFLVRYSPKAVLIEFPSQPLFDVIHLDTEIFFIGDRIIPYEKAALEELKKRVHYCENAEEAIAKLGLFLNGKLEKKRDSTFYKHYVYKKDAEKNILDLVERLANS